MGLIFKIKSYGVELRLMAVAALVMLAAGIANACIGNVPPVVSGAVALAAAIALASVAWRIAARLLAEKPRELSRAISSITDLLDSSPDTSAFLRGLCAIAAGAAQAAQVELWRLRAGAMVRCANYSPDGTEPPSECEVQSCKAAELVSECIKLGTPTATADAELIEQITGRRDAASAVMIPLPAGTPDSAAILLFREQAQFWNCDPYIVSVLSIGLMAARADASKAVIRKELAKLRVVSGIMCEVGPQAVTSDVRSAVVEAASTVLDTPYVTMLNIDPCMGDVEHGETAGVTELMREAFLEVCGDVLTDRSSEEVCVVEIPETKEHLTPAEADIVDSGIRSLLAYPIRSCVGATGALVAFYEASTGARDNEHLIEAVTVQASAMLSYTLAIEQSRNLLDDLAGVNQELSVQATEDGLTGLVNHRTLQQRLSELCKSRGLNKNGVFSLVMVDVDHFKLFNDTYGHQEGDVVLGSVARVLASKLRQSDFAARYGGEEFALVIRGVGKEDALPIADRIRRAVSDECKTKGTITVSMGIAEFPGDGNAPDEIIERADKALYHAKVTGRNRVVVWGSAGCETSDDGGTSEAKGATRSILVVEHPGQDQAGLMRNILERGSYRVEVAGGPTEATELLRVNAFDAALVAAEALPDNDLKALSAIAAVHPHMPTILVTTNTHLDDNREALRRGASDVVLRPFSSAELPLVIERNLERRRLERQRLTQRSTGLMLQAIDALVAAVDSRDHFTVGHTDEVTALSLGIADQLRVSQEERAALELAAKLHDVGKLALPDSALNKQSQLNEEEWAAMREHPILGSRIVGAIDELAYVSTIIRHHHERLDGTGYPDGLCGQAIPYLSRVIAVADAYEAMTSDRSHRHRMTAEEAISELRRFEGVHYEPEIITALEEHLKACEGVADEHSRKAA